jgi:HAD superfamily hydrolase (TIGR01549 family)
MLGCFMELIIFDLQGTLLENGVFPSPIKQVRNILNIDMRFHDYVLEFEKVFMINQYDTLGKAFHAVAEHFDIQAKEFLIEKLVGIWNKNKLLSRLFPESLDVLNDIKQDHKVALVANIDSFSKDVVEKFKLQEYFDKIYLSCDTGMLKSDPKLYAQILSDFGIGPDDALIVGDSIESDMFSASKAGIKSVLVDRNDRMDYEPKISTLKDVRKCLSRGI